MMIALTPESLRTATEKDLGNDQQLEMAWALKAGQHAGNFFFSFGFILIDCLVVLFCCFVVFCGACFPQRRSNGFAVPRMDDI